MAHKGDRYLYTRGQARFLKPTQPSVFVGRSTWNYADAYVGTCELALTAGTHYWETLLSGPGTWVPGLGSTQWTWPASTVSSPGWQVTLNLYGDLSWPDLYCRYTIAFDALDMYYTAPKTWDDPQNCPQGGTLIQIGVGPVDGFFATHFRPQYWS